MVSHATLTGSDLHEPKGVAAAVADAVYFADGSGSGTWEAISYQTLPVGSAVAVSHVNTSAMSTITTTIPYDDTIPQNTEGGLVLTLVHTPKSSTNKLYLRVSLSADLNTSSPICLAIFKDSSVNAFAASSNYVFGYMVPLVLETELTAGSTSAQTFTVRAGPSSAGVLTINGEDGVRRFGGVCVSSLTITEVKA